MREWLRDHGLLIANLALFLIFFGGMVLSGVRVYNSNQLEHGEQPVSLAGYLLSGDFYEATFENWESEFLQMGMYVVLTAFLFQKDPRSRSRLTSLRPRTRTHARQPTVQTRHGPYAAAAGCLRCTNTRSRVCSLSCSSSP
jgi:hypothetical protein